VDWFEEVMGCCAPLSVGPFCDDTGTFMQDLLDVDPRAVIHQITMVRCGQSANIELFDYSAPDQRTDFPRNSDFAGHHIAFYVTDLDAAIEYMVAHGAQKFFGPLPVTDGPAAGQSINYFKTPFGTYIELISYPNGMAYEAGPSRPLWSPKRNGTTPVVTSVPGLLGIDHVGITVPNVDEAVAWFENVLGCTSPLAFGPFAGVGDVVDVEEVVQGHLGVDLRRREGRVAEELLDRAKVGAGIQQMCRIRVAHCMRCGGAERIDT
jgi:catechol 2,3-dioxygenase-like lactoylglutathione lyase family enzyme